MRRRAGQRPARAGRADYAIAVTAVALVGTAVLLAWLFSSSAPGNPGVLLAPGPAGAASPEDAARNFLTAFTSDQYGDMWGMMAEAPRRTWGKSDALAGFLTRKFGGKKLSFRLGGAEAPAAWRDPESGSSYEQAITFPVTLTVDGQEAKEFSFLPIVTANEKGLWVVVGLGPASRRAPVFTPVPRIVGTAKVPILVYHHVKREWPDDFQQRTITVTAADFEAQLARLRDEGYRSISLSELGNALLYGLPLPPKPVVLTFDDGYDDMFTVALPLLQKYRTVGSFGLITSYVGKPGYLTWDQVGAMKDAGMEMVSHTVTHANLGALAADAVRKEIAESRATLEEELGAPMQTMIYPYGEPFAHGNVGQQQAVLEMMEQEGYAIGVTNPLPNEAPKIEQDASRPYELRRVMVSGGLPLNRFAARLEGRDLH